jgi:lipid A 3-O-deacylase
MLLLFPPSCLLEPFVKTSLFLSACLAAVLAPVATFGQDAPATPENPQPALKERDKGWRFNTYLENDSTWLKPNAASDRWYTNGIKLEITHQPQWAQDHQDLLPFAKQFGPANVALGYHAGQMMFTPRHIDIRKRLENDRPFAGYLFGGAFIQRANDTTLDHFQVDLGIIGPSSLAQDTQHFIHRNIAGDNPVGWGNQMRDEPAIQAYLRKKWRFDIGSIPFGQEENSHKLNFQIIPEAGIAVGTVYRHVEAGATLRAGFVLPDDFGPGYISNPASATGSGTPRGWSGYVFVGVAGKGVEHNVFFGDSDLRRYNRVEVDHRPFIGQANAGITVNYHWEKCLLQFTYSQTYLTREFERQNGTPAFGALRVTWSWVF